MFNGSVGEPSFLHSLHKSGIVVVVAFLPFMTDVLVLRSLIWCIAWNAIKCGIQNNKIMGMSNCQHCT